MDMLHLKCSKYIMRANGTWPLKIEHKVFKVLYSIFGMCIRYYFYYITMTLLVKLPMILQESVIVIAANLEYSILLFGSAIKIHISLSKEIVQLISIIIATEKRIMNSELEHIKKIYVGNSKYNYKLNVIVAVSIFIGWALFSSTNFIELVIKYDPSLIPVNDTNYKRPLPMVTWFPFDSDKYYVLAFGMHMVGGCLTCIYYISTDVLMVSLIIYPVGQLQIISEYLRNFGLYAKYLEAKHGITVEESQSRMLQFIVHEHIVTIEFIKKLDRAVKNLMLLDFAVHSLQLASVLFQIMEVEFSSLTIFNMFYVTLIVMQLMLFYYNASEITFEGFQVGKGIFESEWVNYSENIKKGFLLILIRSQKRLTLNVGQLYEMSNEVALKLLKAAFSYVTLLKNRVEKETK